MAEQTADQQRRRRERGRERRRSMTTEPFEQLDEKAGREDGSSAVKQTLATAAAGALAAGIAGAAKALRDRQRHESAENGADPGDDEAASEGGPPAEESRAEAQPADTQPETEDGDSTPEPAADAEQHDDQDEADQREETQAESAAGDEQQDGQDTDDADARDEPEQRQGASPGQVKDVVENARRQLQEILGVEPESVSGFERNGDCWTVTLEVVEVRRIPESTDVLSSYEVTIDDDGNVVGAAPRRRYRRSQVEEG
jgi:hypothetical protein